jgi:hypothetical protein
MQMDREDHLLSLTSITGGPLLHWATRFTANPPTANSYYHPSNKQATSLHDDQVHFQRKWIQPEVDMLSPQSTCEDY